MKTFKYRVWDKENLQWFNYNKNYNGNEITGIMIVPDGFVIIETDEGETWLAENDYEISQYTGLNDKNNVEIYEGDILKREIYEGHPEYYEVVFASGGFKRKPLDSKTLENEGLFNLVEPYCKENYEVVDNIYERNAKIKTSLLFDELSTTQLPEMINDKDQEERWQDAIKKEYAKNNQLDLRAWHKNLKLMEKVEALYLSFGSCRTTNYNENIKNFILMRFTGLYDKDGNKIYEGDIVKGCDNTIFEVRYLEHLNGIAFCINEFNIGSPISNMSESFKKNCKVIGNVYEDKESLK